ncbi:MAG: acetyl-CoA carboxylase carboxyltransferase subunit alpha [Bradymonadales bacterium]|nr:MAG: acetyl-CoA carboxylase carboxyltransferase subunit alpha [Bradymonadales bacterium]
MEKKRRYLEFEKDLASLDEEIQRLKDLKLDSSVDISSEIRRLESKAQSFLEANTKKLTAYQKIQISRHPDRPNFLEYVGLIFDEFIELKGDRKFRDDPALVGGLASLEGQSVMIVGHQKGRSTSENVHRNFGMPRPEGYRKALRLFELAEHWSLPLLTFVDTPGAYPGMDAEERGQSEAIAQNILRMASLKVPILSVVTGEGGSGGALAIAVCNRLLMMQYSTYSVISPEGCAAITWKDPRFTEDAAEALKLTAEDLQAQGLCDYLIKEPLGGAHRHPIQAAKALKEALVKELSQLKTSPLEEILESRFQKYRAIGCFGEERKPKLGQSA